MWLENGLIFSNGIEIDVESGIFTVDRAIGRLWTAITFWNIGKFHDFVDWNNNFDIKKLIIEIKKMNCYFWMGLKLMLKMGFMRWVVPLANFDLIIQVNNILIFEK